MIALLAPAKKLDFESDYIQTDQEKMPPFMEKTENLVSVMRGLDREGIKALMKVSDSLADLTARRFLSFSSGNDPEKRRPAVFAFKGETYTGLHAEGFDREDLLCAETQLRILSGLYGVLSPLTWIEPYRLEMGLTVPGEGKLAHYWKESVTEALNRALAEKKVKAFINLASAEYLAAVDRKRLDGALIDIVFKEERGGKLKVISTLAKKARGMMAAFMVRERIEEPEDLKGFQMDGYAYVSELSDARTLTFVREER